MTNKELEKIMSKEELEKRKKYYLIQLDKIIKKKSFCDRYLEYCKSLKCEVEKDNDIYEIALDLFEERGFSREEFGTRCFATLAEYLYHERNHYQRNKEDKIYNLNDEMNNHYFFLTQDFETEYGKIYIVESIKKSKENSYVKDKSINEIVYEVTNDIINQYDIISKQVKYELKNSECV